MNKAHRQWQAERRCGADRRRLDQGPPARRDRRIGVEPRKPEVVELGFTPSEWDTLCGQLDGQTPPR